MAKTILFYLKYSTNIYKTYRNTIGGEIDTSDAVSTRRKKLLGFDYVT